MCLQDVKLHSPGDRSFDDIGGLEDVKSILIESLLWPLQVILYFFFMYMMLRCNDSFVVFASVQ